MTSGSTKQRWILIVDDSVNDTCLITEQIEHLQLEVAVETAMTAEEGLLKIRRKDYDLVLCDFKLPGITGLAFMKLSLEMRPQTPVVFVTGYDSDALKPDTEIERAYALLHKPVSSHILRQIVTDALVYRARRRAA
jgi:DNA-binding NtrC family response regulator